MLEGYKEEEKGEIEGEKDKGGEGGGTRGEGRRKSGEGGITRGE